MDREVGPIIARCYDSYLSEDEEYSSADFYRAICETVEYIIKSLLTLPCLINFFIHLIVIDHPFCTQNVPRDNTTSMRRILYYSNSSYIIAIFYREINKKLGSTQFRVPKTTSLKLIYEKHGKERENTLTKEEFQEMLQEVIIETGFSGIGAKDILFYIFGVPISALLCKQRIGPKAIPNDLFIPVVTSATVFLLAKLNKI